MIRMPCPRCGRQFAVSEENGGRKGKCPSCGEAITVPVVVPAPRSPSRRAWPISVAIAMFVVASGGAAWWYSAASRRAMAQRTEACWREYRKATSGVGLIIDPPAIVKGLDQVNSAGSDPRLVSLVADSRTLWRDVEQRTGGSSWKLSAQAFFMGFAGGYLNLSSGDEQGLARALGLETLDQLKSLERRAEDLRQAFGREYGPDGCTFE